MKIFISADIEGVVGSTFKEECRKGDPEYKQFADQMTLEVVAACEGAIEAGATEVVVKDGHGLANNIDVFKMPKGVKLIRGKSGHPYNMMYGLDESFDAVMFIGYHSGAGNAGSPLSHTSTGATNYIKLNGMYTTEFLINSYTAENNRVPVVFLSGDSEICNESKRINPNITTVITKECYGGSTVNLSREEALQKIKSGVKDALTRDISKCHIGVPEEFEEIISFKDHVHAFRMKFYPGMEKIDDHTIKLVTKDYMDIITANTFVL